MKAIFFVIIPMIILLLTANINMVYSDEWDPFHTKEEKINMWKDLWDSNSKTNYKSIGKTYAGNDIWLFSVGNSSGGRILFDGEMHGNEDKGSELLYLLAQWLLESSDPEAERILQWNYILFIPQLNDQNDRGNANTQISPYGVDINRNFETGWWLASPNDDTYGGPYPLSEPETNILRQVFLDYEPTFYVNMHCGAGPYAAYSRNSNTQLTQEVISRTNSLCQSMQISPYRNPAFGSQGYAIGDAIELGVKSAWLIETVGQETAWKHLPEHYQELEKIYLPKCLALFIAMAETCSDAPAPITILEINQNPPNAIQTTDTVIINAIIQNTTQVTQVLLNYNTGTTINYKTYMQNDEKGEWSGKISPTQTGTTVTYTIEINDNLGTTITSEPVSYEVTDSTIPEFSPNFILIIFLLSFSVVFSRILQRYIHRKNYEDIL